MSWSTSRNCLERRIFGFLSTKGGSWRGLDLRRRSRAPGGKDYGGDKDSFCNGHLYDEDNYDDENYVDDLMIKMMMIK